MTNKKIRVQDSTGRDSVKDRKETCKEDQADVKKKKSKKTQKKKQDEAVVDESSESRLKW